ncbi:MAG: hypothetical protein K2M19_01925 [Muribaculaceae bacterium]|nr:hypothetical protein [Muribaculaceae bacterium]
MMRIKHLVIIIGIFLGCMLSSCSSREDKFVGSWSRTFGLRDNYTQYRVIADKGKSFFQTFTFEKGKDGKGTFTDYIAPVMASSDQFAVGSKISGEWEIKDAKLYLYFDGELSLTNADKESEDDKFVIASALAEKFLSDIKSEGEKGIPYEFGETNGREWLKFKFKGEDISLLKDKNN